MDPRMGPHSAQQSQTPHPHPVQQQPPGSPLVSRTNSAAVLAASQYSQQTNIAYGMGHPAPPQSPASHASSGRGTVSSSSGSSSTSHFRKAANRLVLDTFHSLTAPLRLTWQAVAGTPGRRQTHLDSLKSPAADSSLYARHPKLALDPFGPAGRGGRPAPMALLRRFFYLMALAGLVFMLYSRSPRSLDTTTNGGPAVAAPDSNKAADPAAGERPAPAIGSRPWYKIPYTDADVEADAAVARNVEAGKSAMRLRKRDVPEVPDGRRYMMYMYHSGLNNQRVSLSNALMISKTLNLTLVVPPAMLGDPIPHRPFAVEQRLLSETHLSNVEPNKCRFVKRPKKWKDMKLLTCIDRNGRWNRIMLPWEELFKLDPLRQMGFDWITMDEFMEEVGVDVRDHKWMEPFDKLNQTVVFEDDDHVWAYRFAENGFKPPWQPKKGGSAKSSKHPSPRQPVTLGKYRGPLLNLSQLRLDLEAQESFRILHFGSVFGSDRVIMSSKDGQEMAKAVEDTLLYSNPKLHSFSDKFVERLGGRGSFIGLHLRIGEARGGGEMFNSKPDETVTAVLNEVSAWLESAKANATAHGKNKKRSGGTKNLKGLWKKVIDPNRKPEANAKRKKSAKAAKLAQGGMIAVGSVPAPRKKHEPVSSETEDEQQQQVAKDGKAPEIDEARPPRYNNIGSPQMPMADALDEPGFAGSAGGEGANKVEGEGAGAPAAAAATNDENASSEPTTADESGAAVATGEEGNSTEASTLKKAVASHELSPYLPADPSSVSDPESLLEICKHLHATSKEPWQFPIIYIATDALDARNNPSFRTIFAKFPCTFLLSDFITSSDGLAKARDVQFPAGSLVPQEVFTKKTAHLFIPLIDQMVVAQGKVFFGTPKSTFSTFAARLHRYWVEMDLHPTAKPKAKGKKGKKN